MPVCTRGWEWPQYTEFIGTALPWNCSTVQKSHLKYVKWSIWNENSSLKSSVLVPTLWNIIPCPLGTREVIWWMSVKQSQTTLLLKAHDTVTVLKSFPTGWAIRNKEGPAALCAKKTNCITRSGHRRGRSCAGCGAWADESWYHNMSTPGVGWGLHGWPELQQVLQSPSLDTNNVL